VPGITAATSAAAVLGAPLTHDFACISLSDLLTDRGLIINRIRRAAEGDFVIVLYNPKSRSRITLFDEALEIIKEYRKEDTPVGIVRNGHREGQKTAVTTLQEASVIEWVDMRCVVIVGNSQTYTRGNWIITPRGYV
jgi:precorrin-3B C17-methyltransferase